MCQTPDADLYPECSQTDPDGDTDTDPTVDPTNDTNGDVANDEDVIDEDGNVEDN